MGSLIIIQTAYDAEAVLDDHAHAHAYVSRVLDGEYLEVGPAGPKRCGVGTVILHESAETHADYFHRPTRVLNVEIETTTSPDLAIAAMEAWLGKQTAGPKTRIDAFVVNEEKTHDQDDSPTPSWLGFTLSTFDWASARPLKEAARIACVHPSHFSRVFHYFMGMRPGTYRLRERVRLASGLLLNTTDSVSDISYRMGFSDQSHFTNSFRRATGLTPARYRRLFWR